MIKCPPSVVAALTVFVAGGMLLTGCSGSASVAATEMSAVAAAASSGVGSAGSGADAAPITGQSNPPGDPVGGDALTGRVLNSSGQPMPGQSVEIFTVTEQSSDSCRYVEACIYKGGQVTTTDAQGNYHLATGYEHAALHGYAYFRPATPILPTPCRLPRWRRAPQTCTRN